MFFFLKKQLVLIHQMWLSEVILGQQQQKHILVYLKIFIKLVICIGHNLL